MNPTWDVLEQRVAALGGRMRGLCRGAFEQLRRRYPQCVGKEGHTLQPSRPEKEAKPIVLKGLPALSIPRPVPTSPLSLQSAALCSSSQTVPAAIIEVQPFVSCSCGFVSPHACDPRFFGGKPALYIAPLELV